MAGLTLDQQVDILEKRLREKVRPTSRHRARAARTDHACVDLSPCARRWRT
jgi:hypothetical protein